MLLEGGTGECFGEHIGDLVGGGDLQQFDVALGDLPADVVLAQLEVLVPARHLLGAGPLSCMGNLHEMFTGGRTLHVTLPGDVIM